jgi:hypothetical protein
MIKDQFKFRILNKSKEGAIVKLASNEQVFYSWEDFNRCFSIVDQKWAVFNEEMQKRQSELDDKINMLCVYVQQCRVAELNGDYGKYLTSAGVIGTLSTELQTELGCSLAQLMDIVQRRLRLLNPMMRKELRIPEPNVRRPKQRRYQSESKSSTVSESNPNRGKHSNMVEPTATQSLADVKGADKLKALKDQFNKEEEARRKEAEEMAELDYKSTHIFDTHEKALEWLKKHPLSYINWYGDHIEYDESKDLFIRKGQRFDQQTDRPYDYVESFKAYQLIESQKAHNRKVADERHNGKKCWIDKYGRLSEVSIPSNTIYVS